MVYTNRHCISKYNRYILHRIEKLNYQFSRDNLNFRIKSESIVNKNIKYQDCLISS